MNEEADAHDSALLTVSRLASRKGGGDVIGVDPLASLPKFVPSGTCRVAFETVDRSDLRWQQLAALNRNMLWLLGLQ
jgi:hypothetical protein